MAKVSATEKNKRRSKLVDRFAAKRAALKAIISDRTKPMDERFRAQLKLNELPRNLTGTVKHVLKQYRKGKMYSQF